MNRQPSTSSVVPRTTTLTGVLQLHTPEPEWIRFENPETGMFWEFSVNGSSYTVREGQLDGDSFCGKPMIIPGSGNSTIFASQTGFSRIRTSHRQLKTPESVERSIAGQIERREDAGYILV